MFSNFFMRTLPSFSISAANSKPALELTNPNGHSTDTGHHCSQRFQRMLKSYLHPGTHSRRPKGENFANTAVWVSTDPAAAPLRVRLSFTPCAEWIRGFSVRTAKSKLEPRSADAGTLGAGLDPLSRFVQSLHSCQTEQLWPLLSQITTQKCLYFIISFEPYVGIYSTKPLRDTLVWKYKIANLGCFFVSLVFHWSYLPT